jgi:hypothetical protein
MFKTHAKHTHQRKKPKISNLFHIDETSSYIGPELNDFQILSDSIYQTKTISQLQDFLFVCFFVFN